MGPLPCVRGRDSMAVRSQQEHLLSQRIQTAPTGPNILKITADLWSVSGGFHFWRPL